MIIHTKNNWWTLAIFRGHKQRTLAEKPSVHAGIVLLSLIFLATQTTRHELQKFKTVLFCEKNHDQKLAKPHNWKRTIFLMVAAIALGINGCGQSPDDSSHRGADVRKDVGKSVEHDQVASSIREESSSSRATVNDEKEETTAVLDWTNLPNPFEDNKHLAGNEVSPNQEGESTAVIPSQPCDIIKVKSAVSLLQLELIAKVKPLSTELQKEKERLLRQFKGDVIASLTKSESLLAAKWWRMLVLEELQRTGKVTKSQLEELNNLKAEIYQAYVIQDALKPHAKFEVAGKVTDESGKALDDVTVTILKAPPIRTLQKEYEDGGHYQISGRFEFQIENTRDIAVRFSKHGYFDENVFYFENNPIHRDLHITLEKIGPPVAVKSRPLKLQYSISDGVEGIRLDTLDMVTLAASQVEKDTKYPLLICVPQIEKDSIAVVDYQPKGVYAHLALLRRIKIQVMGPDVGIIPFTPVDDKPIKRQMQTAPEKGYESKEIIVTQDYLRRAADMRASGGGEACGVAYFYFKINGKYGRCELYAFKVSKDMQLLQVLGKIDVQPDGSRNLGWR